METWSILALSGNVLGIHRGYFFIFFFFFFSSSHAISLLHAILLLLHAISLLHIHEIFTCRERKSLEMWGRACLHFRPVSVFHTLKQDWFLSSPNISPFLTFYFSFSPRTLRKLSSIQPQHGRRESQPIASFILHPHHTPVAANQGCRPGTATPHHRGNPPC